MSSKIPSFVIFTRDIHSLFIDKVISKDEYLVYMHLRLSANPFGIATTSLPAINNDLLRLKSTNYANKIMLALKGQRLLFYKKRTGSRGSFRVWFPNFVLPGTRKITNIDKCFEDENAEPTPEDTAIDIPELDQSFEQESQNSAFRNDHIGQMLRAGSDHMQVIASNTNTETNKETNYKQISKDLGNQF